MASDIIREMRTSAPPLAPIFRSAVQARLLLEVLTSHTGLTATDLARRLREPQPTVAREAKRLVEAGLLRTERVGRSLLLSATESNPATLPLRQLLIISYGPSRLVGSALAGISGIDAAYVHGSWAARYVGEPGKPPGDIDVLVIGRPDRRRVDEALGSLEAPLGREVNVTYVSPERWESAEDAFVTAVRQRPLVPIDLE